MIYQGEQDEYFELQHIDAKNYKRFNANHTGALQLIWFVSDGNKLTIDGIPYIYNTNEIISLSQFHRVEYEDINAMQLLRFNREFYCVLNHDSEVGCKGILYYAAAQIPVVKVKGMELEVMETAWKMAELEFEMKDSLQLEMLQTVLKRILILCTRIYKKQVPLSPMDETQHDLVREFNFLVEQYFREKHGVADYAELLYKSPKTITNTFKKIGEKSPLQVIHDRILLEAKRLLHYTQKDVSEIGYELGFQDVQGFSRFFKNQTGQSPSDFRAAA